MKKFIFILIAAHCSLLTVHLTEGQIIHVPADQPTIQAGINAAGDGDTVMVADGTYLENISFNGKAITVASHFVMDGDTNHINNTIIDGSQPDDPDLGSVVIFITGEDTTSVLCGFTITGGTGMADPVYGARIGGGIVCYYATAKIIRNKICGNEVHGAVYAWGGGIAILRDTGEDWAIISNNVISDNECMAAGGYASGGGMDIHGNSIIMDNTIAENTCTNNLGGLYGCGLSHHDVNSSSDTLILKRNTIRNNSGQALLNAHGGGIFTNNSDCTICDNDIIQNTISAQGQAFGGGVFIDSGISAEISSNNIGINVLHGGDAYGAGIYLYQGSDYEILDNSISSNYLTTSTSRWLGAGMLCDQTGESLIRGNDFVNNYGPVAPVGGGGGLCLLDTDESTITVSSNFFQSNQAYNGGGIFERNCYHSYYYNNVFRNNHANHAGAIAFYHPLVKQPEDVSGHRSNHPMVVNNTFLSNNAIAQGGAIRYQSDIGLNPPEILNCIFWQNTSPSGKDIYNSSSFNISVSYSDIDEAFIAGGPWTGGNNIYADPLFNLPMDPYCHLSAISPCRDTGIVNFNTPGVDFDGEPRPDVVDNLMDLGADEYYPGPPMALEPEDLNYNYFVALWNEAEWTQGYYLDVAFDVNFENMVPGYENVDAGTDTSYMVCGLATTTYFFRVRTHYGAWTSSNSNTVDVELPDEINELKTQNSKLKIAVWPNPTTNVSGFGFRVSGSGHVTLRIFDIHGREVAAVLDAMLPAGEHVVHYDMSGLPAGVYFVELRAKGEGRRAEGEGQRAVGKVLKIN